MIHLLILLWAITGQAVVHFHDVRMDVHAPPCSIAVDADICIQPDGSLLIDGATEQESSGEAKITTEVKTLTVCPANGTVEIGICEPEDVPAIQVNVRASECFRTWEGCTVFDKKGNLMDSKGWFAPDVVAVYKRWSCADKSRILLHDENEPPKYYCHRVNP
jgi:hypothetical protein